MAKVVGLLFAAIFSVTVFAANNAFAELPNWMSSDLRVEDFYIPAHDEKHCSYRNKLFSSVQDNYYVNRTVCLLEGDGWTTGWIGYVDIARDKWFESSIVDIGSTRGGTVYTVKPNIFNNYDTNNRWFPIMEGRDAIYLHSSGDGKEFELYRYDDMPSKFHKNSRVSSSYGYTFDQSGYAFRLMSSNNEALKIATFSLSENSEWAVGNVRGIGVVVMDFKTNGVYRVSLLTEADWEAINGDNTGLAISNDGKYVARLTPTSQEILTVDHCGDVVTNILEGSHSLERPCQSRDIGDILGHFGYRNYSRYANLTFDKYMRWLDFDAGRNNFSDRSVSGRERFSRVRLTTEEYVEPLEYLALGDSYSSGEGDVANGPAYYAVGTGSKGLCHLSRRSYPYLLRDHYLISDLSMASVACSGAVVENDYYRALAGYKGQNDRLKDKSQTELESIQQKSLENFSPGNVPQLEFIRRYQPHVVTLTGGGNDIGFARIIQYCASPNFHKLKDVTCDYAIQDSKLQKTLYSSIDNQYKHIVEMIEKIQVYSSYTRVIIIGYPKFINPSPGNCKLAGGFLDVSERKMIDEGVVYMNNMLLRAATDTGVTFIDITDSLKGGRICEGSEYVSDLWALGIDKIRASNFDESFHPNAEGHKKMAQAIIDSNELYVSSENSQDINNKSYSRNFYETTSEYEPKNDGTITLQAKLFDGDVVLKSAGTVEVSSPSGMFEPGSVITVVANSETVVLGEFRATEDGSLGASVSTSLLPLGYHVITASGKSSEGGDVTIYQFVLIKEDENDDSYARSLGFDTESSDAPAAIKVQDHSNLSDTMSPLMEGATGLEKKRIDASDDSGPAQISNLNSSKKRIEEWFSLKNVSLCVILLIALGGLIYGIAKRRRKTKKT